MGAEVTACDKPIDYNPCVECKLCVSACPVGAIGADGRFNLLAKDGREYRLESLPILLRQLPQFPKDQFLLDGSENRFDD